MNTSSLVPAVALCVALAASSAARALEAGWTSIDVPADASGAPTTVALFYPTASAGARAIPMGPFTVTAAPRAAPTPTVRGLILLSHGTGGSELAHASLAQALARQGYLVAALRHPGDNWQDRSLLANSPQRYFDTRPRQASRVIDALLASADWGARIARDAGGPRVAAFGHSAGGYTVLALAGAQPDLALLAGHCATDGTRDPIFCSMGRAQPAGATPAAPRPQVAPKDAGAPLRDPRVRAVAALAPVGAVLTESSLASIAIPVALYEAELDRFLVPAFHSRRIAARVPGIESHRVANAGHFAFVDTPASEIPSEDGDLRWNPPGFERSAFLAQLAAELPAFFERAFERSAR